MKEFIHPASGKIIKANDPYTGSDGTQYPRNWPKEDITELVEITDGGPQAGEFERVASRTLVETDGAYAYQYTYEEIDGAKQSALKNIRESRIRAGLEISGVKIGGDDQTLLRLTGARISAEADSDYVAKWSAENGVFDLTGVQIIAISNALRDHTQQCFNAYFTVRGDLDDYDTRAEIETAFDEAYDG